MQIQWKKQDTLTDNFFCLYTLALNVPECFPKLLPDRRKIVTFITDIDFRLMNRDLGEYESMCFRLAIIADSEFSRWREPEAAVCKTNDDNDLSPEELHEKYKNALDTYKKRLNFQSAWVVQ